MGLFGSKVSVGLDIGGSAVRVAQLRRVGSALELERFAQVPLFPEGDRPTDPDQVRAARIQAVKNALAAAHVTAKTCVSSVSGESVIVRYLRLPEMPEAELKKALQWEAEEYIPFRLDEVNIDSTILGKPEGEADRLDVLLVSAKKDMINDHLAIIRQAGLTPRIIDVDSFAYLNCYEANYGQGAPEECVALLNIGADITGISMYHRGVSRFSRDIPIGGETMTAAVRSHLRCSYAEAEQLKIKEGADPPSESKSETGTTGSFSGSLMDTIRGSVEQMTGGAISKEPAAAPSVGRALSGVVRDLVAEVRRSIEFFENQMRGLTVSRMVLGGGSAALKNLKEHFERDLSLPCEVMDPLRKVRPSGRNYNPAVLESTRQGLGVVVGLGLRGVAA